LQELRFGKERHTILHRACDGLLERVPVNVIRDLLSRGALSLINTPNDSESYQLPLHLLLSEQSAPLDILQLLLEHGADISATALDWEGNTPLFVAVSRGNLEAVKILHKHAQSLNDTEFLLQQSTRHGTVLHCAAERSATNVLRYLIQMRADLNLLHPSNKTTPLVTAIQCESKGVLRVLLEANVDLKLRCPVGLTALHYACGKRGRTGLELAGMILDHAKSLPKPIHLDLLRQKDKRGQTPLFSCVIYSNTETLKLLLSHNARINERDFAGETVLFRSIRFKNPIILECLLRCDQIELNLQNHEDKSALYIAQELQVGADMIKLLKDHGAVALPAKRTINELHQGTTLDFNDVVVREKVGAGSFGRVHRGKWLGVDVAIKFFTHEDAIKKNSFVKEVEMLESLSHPNIVNFYGQSISNENEYCIVMEYLPFTLFDVIKSHDLSEQEIVRIMKGVASGTRYLHHQSILHRDLKPSNILLNTNLEPKIADFGISRSYDGDGECQMTSIGTPLYMAPENINRSCYSSSADIYAFGMIFLQMFTKQRLFHEMGDKNMLCILFHVAKNNVRPTIPDHVPVDLKLLIERCWNSNSSNRPSAEEICSILESRSVSQSASGFGFASSQENIPLSNVDGETIFVGSNKSNTSTSTSNEVTRVWPSSQNEEEGTTTSDKTFLWPSSQE